MPEFTGERVLPGEVDADLFHEHFSRYAFARRFASGKRVLDMACGSGYGSATLAEVAADVIGIDVSEEAVAYAREHYHRENLRFEPGDASREIAGTFDLIVAFEVIEHLSDWEALLLSASAALSGYGLFLVSTPNKPLYAEARGESGRNPFHVHEFEYGEFRDALGRVFPHVRFWAQNHSAGVLFSSTSGAGELQAAATEQPVQIEQAGFFVAACSHQPITEAASFFSVASSANLLHERDRHIALLNGEVLLRKEWEARTRAELDGRNREFDELLSRQRGLQEDLEARNRFIEEQTELLRQRGERILSLQSEVDTAHRDFTRMSAAYEEQIGAVSQAHRDAVQWGEATERRLTEEVTERGETLAKCVDLLHAAEATLEERTAWAQDRDREVAAWNNRYEALRRMRWVRLGARLHLMEEPR